MVEASVLETVEEVVGEIGVEIGVEVAVLDVVVEGVGGKLMSGVLVEVDVESVVRVVDDFFELHVITVVCVVVVEAAVVDKEAVGVGAKGVLVAIVSVRCVWDKQTDSKLPALKQLGPSGNLSVDE